MRAEGWRRLWELIKWLVSLAVGAWVFVTVIPTEVPPPDATPSVGQMFIAVLFVSGLAGGATFGLLHALEWVYRGFRPLPISPKEEAPPVTPNTPEAQGAAQEQLPALPHPDTQQMIERQRGS